MESNGAGNPAREYAHYPGVDQPHAMRRASDGAVFRYTQEQPGHVSGLVGAGNVVANAYTYTPWGEPLSTQEQVPQPLRYAAREYDAETGLYFVRARYYDPQQGRFVSEDPIGLEGGINLYTYVGGNPMNFTDPSGLYYGGTCLSHGFLPAGDPRTGSGGWTFQHRGSDYRVHESGGSYSICKSTTLQDLLPAPGSTCWIEGCILREPKPAEREYAVNVLMRLHIEIPFCRLVQTHGLAALNRNLMFFNNAVITGSGQLLGNAPADVRRGGLPVIYLYSYPGKDRDHVIVHEAVHTVPWQGRTSPFQGYPESNRRSSALYLTPLGTIDQAASKCRRG